MAALDLVIAGGTVVTGSGARRADIGIRGAQVAAVVEAGDGNSRSPGGSSRLAGFTPEDLAREAARVIDARGKLVFPGLVDAHTHFGLGSGDAATSDDFYSGTVSAASGGVTTVIDSGTVSAASGGVTTVIDFATPENGRTVSEAVAQRRRDAAGAVIDYSFHGVVIEPAQAGEIERLASPQVGITSFKLYMTYKDRGLMASHSTLAKTLEEAGRAGGLAGVHAEDDRMINEFRVALVRDGRTALPFFAESRPPEAERAAIEEACRLAEEAGAPLYVFHLSTAGGLEEIRRARARGVTVWAETCPHYLTLTDEVYTRPDGYKFVVNPPLRRPDDVEALWAALAGGGIQVVSSDHCPFPLAVKARGAGAGRLRPLPGDGPDLTFTGVPAGIGGTEMILPVLLSEGVAKGRLTLERVADVTSTDPSRLFGLHPRKGRVGPGADADFAIVDPASEWTVAPGELHSACDYTPYEGLRVTGRVTTTVARGRVVYAGGEFRGRRGHGRFVKCRDTRSPTEGVVT